MICDDFDFLIILLYAAEADGTVGEEFFQIRIKTLFYKSVAVTPNWTK